LAERLRRRLHGPALLKKPASYRTRTSNQNRGPALHVKCAQKSLPVCQGGRSAFQKIRCIAPAAKTSRLPTIPQPQSRTREKSGLGFAACHETFFLGRGSKRSEESWWLVLSTRPECLGAGRMMGNFYSARRAS